MARKGSCGAEIVALMQTKFPKFSKVQLCMIRNPEYGVDFSAAAKRLLRKKETREKRKTQKKITVRLTDDEYLEVQAAMLKTGCKTYRELIEKALGNMGEK